MHKKTSPLHSRQRQDIQVVWKQHKIDPLPIHCAGEEVEGMNLLQIIGQVGHIVEKFSETEQLASVYLVKLVHHQGQAEQVINATQGEKQEYFARLYLLCNLVIQFHEL